MSRFAHSVYGNRGSRRWVLFGAGLGGLALLGWVALRLQARDSTHSTAASQCQHSTLVADTAATSDTNRVAVAETESSRPTRICADLRVFDLQMAADNRVEGAWLARAEAPNPVMVAMGQRFGSGILKRALLNADQQNPEVWMETDQGSCRATLQEPTLARGEATTPLPNTAASSYTVPDIRIGKRLTPSDIERIKQAVKRFPRPLLGSAQPSANMSTVSTTPADPRQGASSPAPAAP